MLLPFCLGFRIKNRTVKPLKMKINSILKRQKYVPVFCKKP